jgi:putative ABC transport system permease protein
MNILFQVAVRNVFRNRRRSLFTLSAILVGLTVVLAISGVSNAFYRYSIENAVNVKLGALQVHKRGYLNNLSLNPLTFNFEYSPEILKKVESVKGVKAASGRIVFRGLVSNGRNQALFFGNAVDVSREDNVCPRWRGTLTDGSRPLNPEDRGQALVGQELARSLNVAPKWVQLPDAKPGTAGEFLNLSGASPQGRQNAVDVQVVGLSRSLLAIEEKRSLTLPLTVAQSLLGLEGKVTEIALSIEDLDSISSVQRKLQAALGDEFEVSTWSDVQPFLRDVLFRQRVMIGIISLILFVLVLFVIANTMTMAVFERTREIGTMLSVGIKRHQIQSIFLAEAVFIGVVGAALGTVTGLIAVLLLNIIGIPLASGLAETGLLHPFVDFGFTLAAFAVAVVCSSLAGIFPARRASHLNPVDALRAS